MRAYSTDPNSPDNPHSPYYQPDHISEFHITQPRPGTPILKPVQTQAEWEASPQPGMGYAVQQSISVTVPETQYTALPSSVQISTLSMKFEGTAKSKRLMTQTFFNANQKNIPFKFQHDIRGWLSQFQFISPINQNVPPETITAKITGVTNEDFTSTNTVAANGTAVSGQNAVNVNSNGQMNIAAGSNINGNSSDVSWSSTEPTTLTFTFSPKAVKAEYRDTDFTGTLTAELKVTFYPLIKTAADIGQASDGGIILLTIPVSAIVARTAVFAASNLVEFLIAQQPMAQPA